MRLIFIFTVMISVLEQSSEGFIVPIRKNKGEEFYKVEIKPFSGYKYIRYVEAGSVGIEDRYVYNDSSVIYLTNFEGSINRKNFEGKKAEENRQLYLLNNNLTFEDTLIIEGEDSNNLKWKEIHVGQIFYGYKGVSLDNVLLYENVLSSVAIKKVKRPRIK